MKIARRTGIALAVVMTISFAVDRLGRVDGSFPLPAKTAVTSSAAPLSSEMALFNGTLGMNALLTDAAVAGFLMICLFGVNQASLLRRRNEDVLHEDELMDEELETSDTKILAMSGGLTLAEWAPRPMMIRSGLQLEETFSQIRRTDASPYYHLDNCSLSA